MATTTTSVMDMNALFTRPELVDAFMDGFNEHEHYWHSSSSSSLEQSPRLTTDVLNILDALPSVQTQAQAQAQKSIGEEEEEEEEIVSIVDPHQERHAVIQQPVVIAEPKKKKKKPVGRPKGSGNKANKKDNNRGIKRPLSGYNEFYKATHQDARKVLQSQNSDKSNVQINQQAVTRAIGSKWKELSDDEKRVYNERARKNKRDYQKFKEMSKKSCNDKACNAEKKRKHATTKSNYLLYSTLSTDDIVSSTTSVGCIKGRMLYYRYNVVSRRGRVNWNLDSTNFHLTLSPNKVTCPPLGYYFCNGERKTLLSSDSEW
eukprot:CAMPEP_0116013930 /NCGR_PEP_ID=MMETSP0321-20121206/6001_1 /TAXON_ID=163516 /ORGANISM="Leptocylindrus danicus var. danicus, Strain B650" /LENGTH=316 /DNA_ID=CAMNT_0003483537 /DNA_START=47 /DNA_END=994 /DNA_ORIENTATION=-